MAEFVFRYTQDKDTFTFKSRNELSKHLEVLYGKKGPERAFEELSGRTVSIDDLNEVDYEDVVLGAVWYKGMNMDAVTIKPDLEFYYNIDKDSGEAKRMSHYYVGETDVLVLVLDYPYTSLMNHNSQEYQRQKLHFVSAEINKLLQNQQ